MFKMVYNYSLTNIGLYILVDLQVIGLCIFENLNQIQLLLLL